ncbi:MAG: outer membrane protein assembly factor [Paludibacteraceae bacterium]|nr:outer membrane protein assembly factor [Paludibacteraceae bacterium]
MSVNKYIVFGLMSLVCLTMHAKDKLTIDGILNWPVIGMVYPGFSPETDWQFGLGLESSFRIKDEQKPSVLLVLGAYTLRHQWYLRSSGTLYMPGATPWMLQYSVQYRDYPDVYYGRGNTIHDSRKYDSKRLTVNLQPMVRLAQNWSVGPMMDLLWEKHNLDRKDTTYMGDSQTMMWGIGLVAQHDTRNNTQFPTKGLFFKWNSTYYEPKLGADCRLVKLEADFRHYVTLWQPQGEMTDFKRTQGSLIFAYQVRAMAALSDGHSTAIPFQMLPTLGGEDLVRGLRTNMFRDNVLWAVQGELRFPIFTLLRGAVFAGVGDVYNTDHWNWTTPKVGYGVGLRLAISKTHVNVRFDVARNNIDKSWSDRSSYSFYFTATESF